MNTDRRILLSGASLATAQEVRQGALLIKGERIEKIWKVNDNGAVDYNGTSISQEALTTKILEDYPDTEVLDVKGNVLMAGGIDAHVHFREPGMTQKADMNSESKAALLGGITSFIDMPNNNPPATSLDRIKEKCRLAEGRCYANWGFHIGADNENAEDISRWTEEDKSMFAGVKVFMGSSTGNMLVDKGNTLEELFSLKDARVLIHSEDESIIKANLEKAKEMFGEDIPMRAHEDIRSRQACIRSTIKALEMAIKYGTKLHVCHVTTAEEVEMIRAAKKYNPEITAETSANYLWFCDEDYDRLGSKVKCNPAIKKASDRAALRQALKEGIIDTIGSDHAPHLAGEKNRPYLTCPSGMPSIQQELSVLLTVADEEEIPLNVIASAMSEKIASMFGIKGRGALKEGNAADILVIDIDKEFTVGESDMGAAGAAYKCGWTPYEGARLKGMATDVFLNGKHVVADGQLIEDKPLGKPLFFMA